MSLFSFLFGRWYVGEYLFPSVEVGWFSIPLGNKLSLRIDDRLSQDPALTERIALSGVGFVLGTEFCCGSWENTLVPSTPFWKSAAELCRLEVPK